MISDIEVKISGAYGEKITANQLYKVLLNFDKMYFKMTDLEKKQFITQTVWRYVQLPVRTLYQNLPEAAGRQRGTALPGQADGREAVARCQKRQLSLPGTHVPPKIRQSPCAVLRRRPDKGRLAAAHRRWMAGKTCISYDRCVKGTVLLTHFFALGRLVKR